MRKAAVRRLGTADDGVSGDPCASRLLQRNGDSQAGLEGDTEGGAPRGADERRRHRGDEIQAIAGFLTGGVHARHCAANVGHGQRAVDMPGRRWPTTAVAGGRNSVSRCQQPAAGRQERAKDLALAAYGTRTAAGSGGTRLDGATWLHAKKKAAARGAWEKRGRRYSAPPWRQELIERAGESSSRYGR